MLDKNATHNTQWKTTTNNTLADQLLSFWFSPEVEPLWFNSTPALDQQILHEFEERWLQAQSGLLSDWLNSPKGSLAMIILLDQLPLNMY